MSCGLVCNALVEYFETRERLKDTKRVIRNHKLRIDKIMATRKKTINDGQYTTQKTKNW